jgi:hypothetical protein
MQVLFGPAKSQVIGDPILVELYRYWEQQCGPRLFPSRASINPADIKRCLPQTILTDVFRDPLGFRYRLVGTGAINMLGRGELTGKWIDRDLFGDFAVPIYEMYKRCVETKRPVHGYGSLRALLEGREWVTIEDIFMPLGDTDDEVTMVLVGVVQSPVDDQGVESWLIADEPVAPS